MSINLASDLKIQPDADHLADNLPAIEARIATVKSDPATSYWLRTAIEGALSRDPVDASNDADILAELLDLRLNAMLQTHGHPLYDEAEGPGDKR